LSERSLKKVLSWRDPRSDVMLIGHMWEQMVVMWEGRNIELKLEEDFVPKYPDGATGYVITRKLANILVEHQTLAEHYTPKMLLQGFGFPKSKTRPKKRYK